MDDRKLHGHRETGVASERSRPEQLASVEEDVRLGALRASGILCWNAAIGAIAYCKGPCKLIPVGAIVSMTTPIACHTSRRFIRHASSGVGGSPLPY